MTLRSFTSAPLLSFAQVCGLHQLSRYSQRAGQHIDGDTLDFMGRASRLWGDLTRLRVISLSK